jgi:pimeloyl-ACP methyl ester carboxylesterase
MHWLPGPVPSQRVFRVTTHQGDDNGGASSTFVTAPDGLRLHVACYGSRLAPNLPVVCLPGLTRTTADFHDLASALAADAAAPRRVIAIDSRGRGRSDYDRDPRNYNVGIELADVMAVLTAVDIAPAVFVGTSRGGILTMLLSSARPMAIAGVVLNDIGPVIEASGLARIKSYVGKLPQPKSFEEGAEILRRLFGQHFPKLSGDEWLAFAHRSYKAGRRNLVPNYDVKLARTLDGINFNRPLPSMWREFDGLGRMPVMVLRGENSDILSEDTVAAMRARRTAMDTMTIPDQGHAPLLTGPSVLDRIAEFVASCDRLRSTSSAAGSSPHPVSTISGATHSNSPPL